MACNEPQGLALRGLALQRGPSGVPPLAAFGLLAVRGDKTGCRSSKTPMLASHRALVRRVRHATVTRDAVLQPRRVPASRRLSHVLGARFDPGGAWLALGWREGAGSPGRRVGHPAGPALAEIRRVVITHGWLPASQPLCPVADTVALCQGQEGGDALAQVQRTAGIGLLETTREWRAGAGVQVEGKGPEGSLLRSTTGTGGSERHAVSRSHCPVHALPPSASRIFF